MINVLIIDDQHIAREYMENVVRGSERYRLVGSLSSSDLAEAFCRRNKVDLVITDVCTHGRKDGIEAAAVLRRQFPGLKLIAVTSMPEESYIRRAREAGIDSFWHKESSPENLITVIDSTMEGRSLWPSEMPAVNVGVATSRELSEAQLRVLRLLCEGLEYGEIAAELSLSVNTVKWHVSKILEITGMSNKTQLIIAVTGKRLIIPKLLSDGEENARLL